MEGAALALQSALGVIVIPLLAWAMSEDRTALGTGQAVRIVLLGLILQFALAVVFLHMPWTQALFETIAAGVQALQGFSYAVQPLNGKQYRPAVIDRKKPKTNFPSRVPHIKQCLDGQGVTFIHFFVEVTHL